VSYQAKKWGSDHKLAITLLSNEDCNVNGLACNDTQLPIDPYHKADYLYLPFFDGFYLHAIFYF